MTASPPRKGRAISVGALVAAALLGVGPDADGSTDGLAVTARQLLDEERGQLFRILDRYGEQPATSGAAFNALSAFVRDLDVGASRDAWRLRFGESLRDVAQAGRSDLARSAGRRLSSSTVALTRSVDAQADRLAGLVTQTTADRIVGTYRAIRDTAPSARQLADALRTGFLSDTDTAWRAQLVGRTEAKAAYHAGAQSGALDLGFRSKTWRHDGAPIEPRDWHVDMDGETVAIDDVFSNGLQYPGDPDGDPSETINCTCSVSYSAQFADEREDLVY